MKTFLQGVANYAGISLAILYLWDFPILLGLLLLANLGVLLTFLPISRGRFLRTAVAAAVLGGAGEALCVGRAGLWVYKEPTAWMGLPIWIPLVWANLFLLFVAGGEALAAAAPPVPAPIRWVAGALFLMYLGQALGRTHPGVAGGFSIALAASFVWFRARADIAAGLVGASVGTLGEILAMREGYWTYTAPLLRGGWLERLGLDGLPITLPLAWGLSAVLLRNAGGAARA